MKKILGVFLITAPLLTIMAGHIYEHGLAKAAIAWVIALAMAACVLAGCYLAFKD